MRKTLQQSIRRIQNLDFEKIWKRSSRRVNHKPYTIIRRFLFELVGIIEIILDRNDWKVTSLLFVSSG